MRMVMRRWNSDVLKKPNNRLFVIHDFAPTMEESKEMFEFAKENNALIIMNVSFVTNKSEFDEKFKSILTVYNFNNRPENKEITCERDYIKWLKEN